MSLQSKIFIISMYIFTFWDKKVFFFFYKIEKQVINSRCMWYMDTWDGAIAYNMVQRLDIIRYIVRQNVVTFQLFICKWIDVQIFSILVSKEMIFSFIIIVMYYVCECVPCRCEVVHRNRVKINKFIYLGILRVFSFNQLHFQFI